MEWMCETEECLINQQIYDNLLQSQMTLDWSPSNYSQFWGRTLQEGLNGKLGTESTLVRNRLLNYIKNLGRVFLPDYIFRNSILLPFQLSQNDRDPFF